MNEKNKKTSTGRTATLASAIGPVRQPGPPSPSAKAQGLWSHDYTILFTTASTIFPGYDTHVYTEYFVIVSNAKCSLSTTKMRICKSFQRILEKLANAIV